MMSDLDTLQRIFRDVFDDETLRITRATSAADVDGWDSVAQVKLVLTIEEELSVRFRTEDVSLAKSVGDLLDIVAARRER
jgi:acyl carrier protein